MEITGSSWTKVFRYAKWTLLTLVLAYFFLVMWMAFYSKAQSRMGMAFETIAHETLLREYGNNLPQMQVFIADAAPGACSVWNFEAVWRRCVVVVLYVRDYRPEYFSGVEREVKKLAEKLRKPCEQLSKLKFDNQQQLIQDLECRAVTRPFKLRFLVSAVKVDDREINTSTKTNRSRPYRWWVIKRDKLFEQHFKGEF